jgi:secondary thiamine-phosphate synthase enzyme
MRQRTETLAVATRRGLSAHVKAALLKTSEQVPVTGGDLALGTWQGLYVREHRVGSHRRQVAVHVAGE